MGFLLWGRGKKPEENRKASEACMELEAVGQGAPLEGEKCWDRGLGMKKANLKISQSVFSSIQQKRADTSIQ